MISFCNSSMVDEFYDVPLDKDTTSHEDKPLKIIPHPLDIHYFTADGDLSDLYKPDPVINKIASTDWLNASILLKQLYPTLTHARLRRSKRTNCIPPIEPLSLSLWHRLFFSICSRPQLEADDDWRF